MNDKVWNDKYRLGIEAIDQQHRQLFDLIAELDSLIAAHAKPGEMQALLQRFLHWAEIHFASEETLLQVAGYPELDSHRKEHADFLATLERDIRLLTSRPLSVTESKISQLLTSWLQAHILQNDRAYIPHVQFSLKANT